MKGHYISHHPGSGHISIDKYNVDFIKFFKGENFVLSLLGSILGVAIWLLNKQVLGWSLLIDINLLYLIIAGAGFIFFLFTTFVVSFAGYRKNEAARLAGRRGLFTFSVMMLVVILGLIITKKIYWDQQFYYLVKYWLTGMIFAGVFAVPFDYGVTFVKGLFKKKRLDMV